MATQITWIISHSKTSTLKKPNKIQKRSLWIGKEKNQYNWNAELENELVSGSLHLPLKKRTPAPSMLSTHKSRTLEITARSVKGKITKILATGRWNWQEVYLFQYGLGRESKIIRIVFMFCYLVKNTISRKNI